MEKKKKKTVNKWQWAKWQHMRPILQNNTDRCLVWMCPCYIVTVSFQTNFLWFETLDTASPMLVSLIQWECFYKCYKLMKNNQTTGNVPTGVELTEDHRPKWHNSCPWVRVPKSTNMTCNIGLPGSRSLCLSLFLSFPISLVLLREAQIVVFVSYTACVVL